MVLMVEISILTAWGQVTTLAAPAEPQPYPRAPEDLNSKCEPRRQRRETRRTLLFDCTSLRLLCSLYRQASPSFAFYIFNPSDKKSTGTLD